jgi:hypothetical protein
MYFKKSAPPIAPATSVGRLSVYQAREQNGSAADAELARIQSSQIGNEERSDIPASNVVPIKPAVRKQSAYLIPYARLRELLGLDGNDAPSVVLNPDRLEHAVRMLLRAVHVDEDWYGRQYPDVREAIAKGVFRSAKHHFIESGYFEGRRPAPVLVDEEWYARAYPDVGESVEFGELGSCQEHFDRYGESEGRLPAED